MTTHGFVPTDEAIDAYLNAKHTSLWSRAFDVGPEADRGPVRAHIRGIVADLTKIEHQQLRMAAEALHSIASEDYRGNGPPSMSAARRALDEIGLGL